MSPDKKEVEVRFTKHNEKWYLKARGGELVVGETVTVGKRDGTYSDEVVGEEVARNSFGDILYEIATPKDPQEDTGWVPSR